MPLYTSPPENLTWHEGSDEAWAEYGAAKYAAALERARDEAPAEDPAP